MTEMEVCDAESCGFRCDREKGHGALHHHPDPMPRGRHEWWVFWPHSEAERLDMSGRPWTGYLLLADVALPMSEDTGVTVDADIRYVELVLQGMEQGLARRGWVRQPGVGLVAVMCERCDTLGCPGSCNDEKTPG